VEVARRTGAEIISADSRQVYRGMDIGTAKITVAERRGVPHHGLDLVDPDERYSAGRFAREAHQWLREITARGRPALIVGGTGFFLRALMQPLFHEPALPQDRRDALRRQLDRMDEATLLRWAGTLEATTDLPTDRQRLMRLLEVALLTGRPMRWWHEHSPPAEPPLRVPVVVLTQPRSVLYRRIDDRVRTMVEQGVLEEVRALLEAGYGDDSPGMSATGYPEMRMVIEGGVPLDEAITKVQAATRRYARRQETWFRHQLPPGALLVDGTQSFDTLADRIVAVLRTGEEVAV
jgi:tRNA dimethylallyltransferase